MQYKPIETQFLYSGRRASVEGTNTQWKVEVEVEECMYGEVEGEAGRVRQNSHEKKELERPALKLGRVATAQSASSRSN